MSGPAILLCNNPHAAFWQLGDLPSSDGPVHLLGWRGFSSVDAGPPAPVIDVICRSLVTNTAVTFLASDVPTDDPDVTGTARSAGFFSHLRGRPLSTVTTQQAGKLRKAFTDAGAPWTLQGQVLLGSQPDDVPKGLGSGDLTEFLGDRWYDRINNLLWILRPGVDGDVAGIRASSPQNSEVLFSTMSKLCSQAEIDWLVVEEDEFGDQLAN